MAYCSDCRQEYDASIVLCQKCGGALIEKAFIAPERDAEVIRMVSICPVEGLVEGSMLKGALESQGLHPRLSNHILPAHGEVMRDWSTHHWGDIRVPEDEVEEARLIVQDFREAIERMPPLSPDSDPGPAPIVLDDEAGNGNEDEEGEVGEEPEPWADLERETPGTPPNLSAVPGIQSGSGQAPAEAGEVALELVSLCGVADLAEGKMIEGALVSQGLHPVFAELPTGMTGGHPSGWHGEIRIPTQELLEARVVLNDFRQALDRRDSESSPSDPASQE